MMKIKRLLAALGFAAFAMTAMSSCDKNNNSADDQKITFEFKFDGVSPTSMDLTVVPSSDEATYYYDLLGKEAYNHLSSEGLQTYFDGELKLREEAYKDELTRDEILAKMLSKGEAMFSFTKLIANTDYYAVAFGVDADGKVTSELALSEVSTPAVNPSANTFEISVSNIANDGADYKVVPSNEDTYVCDIWPKSLVDELGDGETMRYFIEYNSFFIYTMQTNGEFELENEHVNQPGREYYVIAFGYQDGEPTTKLFKKEFKTIGGNASKCTFSFTVSDIAADNATVKVVPSDKQVVYIWNVLDMTAFNKYKKEQGSDRAALEYILNGNIEEEMESEMFKRQHAVEALGRWSGYTSSDEEGADTEKISGLSSGEEYIVWAVAVDANGKPEGEFCTAKFITK